MKKIPNIFLSLLFFLPSVILLFLIYAASWFYAPQTMGQSVEKVLEIPYGYNSVQIRQLLEEEGIIRPYSHLFQHTTKLMKVDGKLQTGEYRFSSSQSISQIIDQLVKGKTIRYSITVPEGFQTKQIARLLADKNIADHDEFLELAKREEQFREGYLFPDTYEFPKNFGAENVLKLMHKNFEDTVYQHIDPKQEFPAGLNFEQIIILASIIEKEAQGAEDKPKIASVFYNRLKVGMPLQSCATIQYLLGQPQEKLTQQDLDTDSPYNTYLHSGLPPGPICNPGLDSILAAVLPAQEEYFYFVLGKEGKHIFSKTYQEHLHNKP
jgi:UPF0755 protein